MVLLQRQGDGDESVGNGLTSAYVQVTLDPGPGGPAAPFAVAKACRGLPQARIVGRWDVEEISRSTDVQKMRSFCDRVIKRSAGEFVRLDASYVIRFTQGEVALDGGATLDEAPSMRLVRTRSCRVTSAGALWNLKSTLRKSSVAPPSMDVR